MPDTYVKLPDGSWAQFPEGTKDADIESALRPFFAKTPQPTQPAQPQEPSTARKFVNTAAELLPAAGAVALSGVGLPHIGYAAGQGYRELVQRGSEIIPAVRDLWNLDPQYRASALAGSTGGSLEGLASLVPGARSAIAGYHEMQSGKPYTGAADIALGGLEAATLGQSGTLFALLKNKPVKTSAQITLGLLGGYGGGFAAREGAKAMGASEDVAGAVERVGQFGGGVAGASAPSAARNKTFQRVAGGVVGGATGAKLGPAGALTGAFIGSEKAPKFFRRIGLAATEEPKPGAEPLAPKPEPTPAPKPSFFDQNVAVIAKADEVASRKPTVDTTTPTQQKQILKTLQEGLDAHKANKTTPPDELVRLHDEFAAANTAKKASIFQQKAVRELARQQGDINTLIEDYRSLSNEQGVDWRLRSEAQVKADIKKAQDYVSAHIEAGKQPPADLVTILDAARNRLITLKSEISLAAHDEAMQSLVASATEGAQAYNVALEKLPVKTRKMLQDLEGETLNILRTRSRNAGGRLKPTDDPWFKLVNDITNEPATSVEVPVESPGGSATWPTNVSGTRVSPGAWVSTDAPLVQPEASPASMPAASSSVSARATKRGSTLFQERPRAVYDPIELAEARRLQDMSRLYEQHQGIVSPSGPINDSFMAEFKNLAYKFFGKEARKEWTFASKDKTPSLASINGAISQRYHLAEQAVVREHLGLPRTTKKAKR